jgi:hypothetical protein
VWPHDAHYVRPKWEIDLLSRGLARELTAHDADVDDVVLAPSPAALPVRRASAFGTPPTLT